MGVLFRDSIGVILRIPDVGLGRIGNRMAAQVQTSIDLCRTMQSCVFLKSPRFLQRHMIGSGVLAELSSKSKALTTPDLQR